MYGPPPVLQGFGTSSGIQSSHFVALLGTLTITPDGNQLFQPNMFSLNLDTTLFIEGYVRPTPTTIINNQQIPVYIRAVSIAKGQVIQTSIVTGGQVVLGPQSGNVLGGSDFLTVYLVLVNEPTIPNYFIPGTVYRLTGDSNVGTFAVAASTGSSGSTPIEEVPISVNGNDPVEDAPFIGDTGGSGDTTPDIPYEGDFGFEHSYLFSILENGANFNIQDAMMGLRPIIARVQSQLSGTTDPNKNYGVEIAFSSSDPTGFMLHMDGDLNKYGFPYQLYFGNELVINNELMTWRQLIPQGPNMITTATKDISVSVNPNHELVFNAPEGSYRDTVTVLIFPLDGI